MMKPARLTSQGAGLLGRGLREIADSLAAGLEFLGLALYWLWLHLVLGVLLLARIVLAVLSGPRGGSSHPRRSGR